MRNNKGFSLIELIIVIAVMGVLVAVIAPNLTKYLDSSKQKADATNMETIKSIVEQACCMTNTQVTEPPAANIGNWVEFKEDSDYFDSDATGNGGYEAFSKFVTDALEEVPKSKVTGGYFWVKITGSPSTTYKVEVKR